MKPLIKETGLVEIPANLATDIAFILRTLEPAESHGISDL